MAKPSKTSRHSAGDETKTFPEKSGNGKTASAQSDIQSQGGQNEEGGDRTEQSQAQANDAASLLTQDHRTVERLFKEFETAESDRKRELAREICKELIVHARLEEEIFYPACREKGVEDVALDEAQVEHDTVKFLVADILERSPGTPFYDAKVAVLAHLVKRHVDEEEKAVSGIIAKARTAGVDMAALGSRLQQTKQRLMESGEVEPPPMRSLQATAGAFNRNRKEKDMERWNERDERGGFMGSDDDDRGFSRGRYSSAEGDDDNGGRYSGRSDYGSRESENDRGWRGQGDQGGQGEQRGQGEQGGRRGYGSGYGQSGGSRSSRGSGYTGQGGYEDDSRFGGAGGGGSGGYGRASRGGYGASGGYSGSRGYGGTGEFGSGGYGGGSEDFGRSGSRSGGGSGGYVTGYGGGYGSGYGGGMGGTEDEFSGGYRRGGQGGGEYGSSRGGGQGSGDYGFSRGRQGSDEFGSSRGGGQGGGGSRGEQGGGGDYSSRGSRGRGGGFEREREEYGRFTREDDDDRGFGGGRRGGGRRGSGPYRDD